MAHPFNHVTIRQSPLRADFLLLAVSEVLLRWVARLTVTVFRVQGGTPPLASRQLITIDANGNPVISKTTLNVIFRRGLSKHQTAGRGRSICPWRAVVAEQGSGLALPVAASLAWAWVHVFEERRRAD